MLPSGGDLYHKDLSVGKSFHWQVISIKGHYIAKYSFRFREVDKRKKSIWDELLSFEIPGLKK